jgi:hypothetical protein
MPTPSEFVTYKIKIVETQNIEMRNLNLLHVRQKEKMPYTQLAELFGMYLSHVKKICKQGLTNKTDLSV